MAKVDKEFNLRDWEWIAVNFSPSEREAMAKVAWLICYKCTPEEISQRKIDPRIVIPLCTIVLLTEIDIIKLKKFEQEANYHNTIFLKRLEQKQESISSIEQGFINLVIDSINPSEKWQSLFETLDIDLRFSLLYNLINHRLPTRDDWRNIFLDVEPEYLKVDFVILISILLISILILSFIQSVTFLHSLLFLVGTVINQLIIQLIIMKLKKRRKKATNPLKHIFKSDSF